MLYIEAISQERQCNFEELNLFGLVWMQTLILPWRRLGKIPIVLPHFKVVSLRFYRNNSYDNSKYKQKIQLLPDTQ